MNENKPVTAEEISRTIGLLNSMVECGESHSEISSQMVSNALVATQQLTADSLPKERVLEFIQWINNNWFIPTEDGFWALHKAHEEYTRTIPPKKIDLFDAEELLTMFLNGEGES